MLSGWIEYVKQGTPAFTVIGLGLAVIFLGATWYGDGKKADRMFKVFTIVITPVGFVILLLGIVSLQYTYIDWIKDLTPSLPMWCISLTLLIQGVALIDKAGWGLAGLVGGIAFAIGLVWFIGGLVVYTAVPGNTVWWAEIVMGMTILVIIGMIFVNHCRKAV